MWMAPVSLVVVVLAQLSSRLHNLRVWSASLSTFGRGGFRQEIESKNTHDGECIIRLTSFASS